MSGNSHLKTVLLKHGSSQIFAQSLQIKTHDSVCCGEERKVMVVLVIKMPKFERWKWCGVHGRKREFVSKVGYKNPRR